ncbi:hypothetical protein BDQ17DRAFT_1375101 [Cyathus striatus]|nr:hypothetical protein BDQ17DRAFT_1375101 [Cyathus striatus]
MLLSRVPCMYLHHLASGSHVSETEGTHFPSGSFGMCSPLDSPLLVLTLCPHRFLWVAVRPMSYFGFGSPHCRSLPPLPFCMCSWSYSSGISVHGHCTHCVYSSSSLSGYPSVRYSLPCFPSCRHPFVCSQSSCSGGLASVLPLLPSHTYSRSG